MIAVTGAGQGRGQARQPTPPAGRAPYRLFWAQLTARLDRAQPDWVLGAPNRNDYPLLSPLPGARIKCNFSRSGLRVEFLLGSTDRATNVRRLDVLVRHLPDLQLLLGPDAVLKAEPLERRTQARIAVYHPGTIDEQHRWPAFLDWFQTTATDLHHALTTTGAVQVEWPGVTAASTPHALTPIPRTGEPPAAGRLMVRRRSARAARAAARTKAIVPNLRDPSFASPVN